MTKRQLLWLFIWIFIFFTAYCIWDKLEQKQKEMLSVSDNNTTIKAQKAQEALYFKATKEGKNITLSGRIATQKVRESLIASYQNRFDSVDAKALNISKELNGSTLNTLFSDLANELSRFESGYLDYHDGRLEIEGITEDVDIQTDLKEKLSLYPDLDIQNNLTLQAPKQSTVIEEALTLSRQEENITHQIDNVIEKINQEINASIEHNQSSHETNTTAPLSPKDFTEDNASQLSPKQDEDNQSITEATQTLETKTQTFEASVKKLLRGKQIQFYFDSNILKPRSQILVNKIIKLMKKSSHIRIEIAGHTDSIGMRASNLALSQNRAKAIKVYMIEHGIEKSRLKAQGYGESQALYKNDTKAHRRLNRRVEFKVIGE